MGRTPDPSRAALRSRNRVTSKSCRACASLLVLRSEHLLDGVRLRWADCPEPDRAKTYKMTLRIQTTHDGLLVRLGRTFRRGERFPLPLCPRQLSATLPSGLPPIPPVHAPSACALAKAAPCHRQARLPLFRSSPASRWSPPAKTGRASWSYLLRLDAVSGF